MELFFYSKGFQQISLRPMQTELVRIRTASMATFTFRHSVLSEPIFDDGALLGENHQKLAAHAG